MPQHPAGLYGKAIGMWYRNERRRAANLAINCNEIEIADGMYNHLN